MFVSARRIVAPCETGPDGGGCVSHGVFVPAGTQTVRDGRPRPFASRAKIRRAYHVPGLRPVTGYCSANPTSTAS